MVEHLGFLQPLNQIGEEITEELLAEGENEAIHEIREGRGGDLYVPDPSEQ